jgi:hypothetical protein
VLPEYINSDFLHNFGSQRVRVRRLHRREYPVPAGASWEEMVIENVLGALPASAQTSFYRTSVGAEIDLIIEFGAKDRWAIEVKRSLGNPAPTKGFYI